MVFVEAELEPARWRDWGRCSHHGLTCEQAMPEAEMGSIGHDWVTGPSPQCYTAPRWVFAWEEGEAGL